MNLEVTVKVLTIFWCQLLFLVVGIKTDKLWSKLKERDHETDQHSIEPKAGLRLTAQVQQAIKLLHMTNLKTKSLLVSSFKIIPSLKPMLSKVEIT